MKVMNVIVTITSPPPASNDGLQRNSSGLALEPVMLTGMRARMEMMRTLVRGNMNCKPMINERRMWRTTGSVGHVDRYECKDGHDADADKEE
jgi:hypothetical protein